MPERIEFTREQLYELVWQKPMSHLAQEYSISDVGLAKLCARCDIPTPPRGYWARLEAGQAPPRPKLPAAKDASPIGLPVARPEEGSPEIRDELSTAVADEKRPENRIAVAERLQSPCELVEEARAALQNAKCDDIGFIERPPDCLDLRVSRGALQRVLR